MRLGAGIGCAQLSRSTVRLHECEPQQHAAVEGRTLRSRPAGQPLCIIHPLRCAATTGQRARTCSAPSTRQVGRSCTACAALPLPSACKRWQQSARPAPLSRCASELWAPCIAQAPPQTPWSRPPTPQSCTWRWGWTQVSKVQLVLPVQRGGCRQPVYSVCLLISSCPPCGTWAHAAAMLASTAYQFAGS